MVNSADTLSQAGAPVARVVSRVGGTGALPASGESREIQKMKNRGNEAKKWLKTKDITFLNAVNYAHFARKSALIGG